MLLACVLALHAAAARDAKLMTTSKAEGQTSSLAEAMVGEVVDLSDKIQEFSKEIKDAKSQAQSDTQSMAATMNKQLEPLDTLSQEAESNSGKSKTESETVTTAIGLMTNAGTETLNLAKAVASGQSAGELKQKALLDDVKYDSSGSQEQLKLASSMTLNGDAAEFEGQYNNAQNFANQEKMKFEATLGRSTMQRDSRVQQLSNKVERFQSDEEKWGSDSKEMNKDAKKTVKSMSKDLKSTEKSLNKAIKKAHKSLNKVLPLALKTVGSTKTFEKSMSKADKDFQKTIGKTVKANDKAIAKNEKQLAKEMNQLTKSINDRKTNTLKQLNDLESQDAKNTEEWAESSKELGKSMKTLAKEIRASAREVDKGGKEVRSDIKEAQREMISEVKQLQEKVEKDADDRVPETQAEIDSSSAQANAMIGQSTTDLAGSIAESTDELDQKVQGASMALSGPLAEAEAHVNKDKTIASSLAASTAGAVSQVTSAANQAEKIQKEAADEATKSQFDMNLGLQELDMALKFGEQQYGILAEGEMEALSQKLSSMVQKLEQPVWIYLSSTLREIGETLQKAKIEQSDSLEDLEMQLKEIYAMLQRNTGDNDFIDVTVPKLLSESTRRMSRLSNGVSGLNKDRDTMKGQVEKMVALSVMSGVNWVNEQLESIRRSVRDNLKDRSHTYFDQLAELMRNVKNLMGDNVANAQEMKDMQTYLKSKLVNLQEELTEAEERQDARVQATDKQVDEITGTKLVEMSTIGSRSTAAAAEAISQQMEAQRQKEAQQLAGKESEMLGKLEAEANSATQKMSEQEALLESSMTKSFENLQESLNNAADKATMISTRASTSIQEFNGAVAGIQRGAAAAGETAVRMSEDLSRGERRMGAELAGAEQRLNEEMADSIKGVQRGVSAYRQREVDKIDGTLAGISRNNREMVSEWEGKIKEGQREVQQAQEGVQGAKRNAESVEKSVEERFQQREGQVSADLEKMQLEERSSQEAATEDAGGLERNRDALSKQNGAILYTLQENADDAATEREAKSSEMLSRLEARVKTVKTENEAEYAGVESALQNAAAAQARDQGDILEAERQLWAKSHKLNMHREEYENKTAVKMKTFADLVQSERDSLEENRDYLDKYERYTHWQQVNLLEVAIELLSAEVAGADNVFDRMEKREEAFAEEVSHMMNGEEFQTLRKIYDADMFVQKATREDEDMVKRLEDHEKDALPWMQKVLLSLDAAHDEMVAKSAAQGAEQHQLDEEAAARTGNTLDVLANMVQGEGSGVPVDELADMTSGAVKKMQDQQSAMGANDQGAINALQSEANDQAADANAEVRNAQYNFKQIQGMIGNTGGSVQDLEDVVKQVSQQRDKQIAQEKKAVTQKANTLIQKVLFQNDDSTSALFDEGQAASSLMQAAPKGSRLGALLQQNQVLHNLNQGLDKKHQELGEQVQQVAELVHQLRGVQTVHPLAAPQ